MQGVLKPKDVMQRYETLAGKRAPWESHWQELADFILPNRNDVSVIRSPGDKRNTTLFDNTAMVQNETLAGSLHGLLTNAQTQWFMLTTGVPELDDDDEVRLWLQKTTRKIHNILNNSNFQTEIPQMYLDLGCFGTSCMTIEEDEKFVVRFSTRHIREMFAAENNTGMIDEVYRCFKWNAVQIVSQFGESVLGKSRQIKQAFEKNMPDTFEIVHSVYPRREFTKNGSKVQKYVSQYILKDECIEIQQGFFMESPYVVPRWTKAAGEVYGRSPGMNALPEQKTLNKMSEVMLIGAQKVIDPPLQAPDDGITLPIRTRPGGIVYYRAGSTDRIEPIFNDTRIDFGFQAMQDRRARVKEAFFTDKLELYRGPQMTATEVMQRTEEQVRLLGPMLARLQSEFLRPLIDRVFEIMVRREVVDPAPEVLQEKNLDVQYSSMIAQTQRVQEAQSINRTMESLAPFVSIDQSVLDNLNPDEALRTFAKIYNFPQNVIRTRKEIEGIRKGRQEAQAQALQAQQQQAQVDQTAKVLPAIAQADMASRQQ